MIPEQTAARTLSRLLNMHPFIETSVVVDVTDTRSTGWPERLQVVVRHASTLTISVLGALASSVRPSYFELERRGPTHQRLGPGLSRESDSLWPLSEW